MFVQYFHARIDLNMVQHMHFDIANYDTAEKLFLAYGTIIGGIATYSVLLNISPVDV